MKTTGFQEKIEEVGSAPLHSLDIGTFQVNLGLRCNQACQHCHHEAGPERTEMMSRATMDQVVRKAKALDIKTIDITGGAPELHANIRDFIHELNAGGHHLMVRTNLSALLEKGSEDLPAFYRQHGVELIASLPCYEKDEVDCIRGDGVFDRSITALKLLNSYGYGTEPGLVLDLVYNPMGAFLPPSQAALKEDYTRILYDNFGIRFTDLFTISNMPIGRFLDTLSAQNKKDEYMDLLKNSFNPSTVENLMCRFQISIGWDGTLYDCDFNQAIGLPTVEGFPSTINDVDSDHLLKREIATDEHCFGCTAGAGSSCGGALLE